MSEVSRQDDERGNQPGEEVSDDEEDLDCCHLGSARGTDAARACGERRAQMVPPLLVEWTDFFARVRFTPSGCWEWAGPYHDAGYGMLNHRTYAHRWAYEAWVAPIPAGLEIDHLCNNEPCVNPAHLEPVTKAENLRRMALRGRHYTVESPRVGQPIFGTHCINGHPWNEQNTYVRPDNGKRACRACKRERMRVYKARARAA